MQHLNNALAGLKRLAARFGRQEERDGADSDEAASPVSQVEASLDILETALSSLAVKGSTPPKLPKTEKKSNQRIRRLEKQCERYAEQVSDLKQSMGKAASSFHKREEEFTARINKMTEDAQSGTVLLEEALREIEKQKKAYVELKKKTDAEDYIAGRIEEETQRISREAQERVEALRKNLDEERDGHRKSLVEQAKKIAALRRELRQAHGLASKLEEQLALEKGESDALAEKIHAWKSTLDRHVDSLGTVLPTEPWRLKMDDGTAYGPVEIGELYAWAKECRIGPDHEVSRDGQAWIKAANVEELRMDWFVQLVDGTDYGPINVFAVAHLRAEEMVASSARVTHRSTGTAYRADDLESIEIAEMNDQNARIVETLNSVRRALIQEKTWGESMMVGEEPVAGGAAPEPPPKLIKRKIRGTTRGAA